jgi:hypothetical protein
MTQFSPGAEGTATPQAPQATDRVVDQVDALRLQISAIAGNEPESSYLEIRPLDPVGKQQFVNVGERDQAVHVIRQLSSAHSVYVGVAPRVRQAGTADDVERVWTLWADCDGPESLERLREFRPLPSIVIRTGSDHSAHAYWPLGEATPPSWARRANRRLALALGADLKATDPARILRPAGTLNRKHDPPRPVVCTRAERDQFTLAAVVGDLPDTPEYLTPPRPPDAHDHFLTLDGLVRTVLEAEEGNRNAALYWAARCAYDDGYSDDDLAALRDAALTAGLTEQETDRTLTSAGSS